MANKDFTIQLEQQLTLYTREVQDKVKSILDEETKKALQEIKDKSPKRKGKYSKGWRIKKEFETANSVGYTIHNSTDYQLSHLLEYGHANRDGSRTAGKSHIQPAEETAVKNIEKRIEKAVKGE